jgi:sugar transferase (PEP-CTERM/EpsH1 system associated)
MPSLPAKSTGETTHCRQMGSRSACAAQRRRIHVVHLVLALNVGGLEQVVIDLCRRIDRYRFRVTIVCIQERGTHADLVEQLGIPVTSLDCGKGGFRTIIPRLIRALYRLHPDILHTHNPHPHFVGSLAASVLRFPAVINTKHGRNAPEDRRSVIANRFAAMLSHSLVAVSADAWLVATDIERVPRRKVRMIHNGIDLEKFPFPDRRQRSGPIRAIHVARLNPIKDQKTLLEAARLVADRVPEFRLTIVGDGPMRDTLRQQHLALRLHEHVEFLGERYDVPALLANSDLFVLSSLKEGLSLTLLEALAMGLALVATDVGGNREVVIPGKTGVLVPSRSPERLADAIVDLMRRPQDVRDMGRRGRYWVEQHFSLDQMVRKYEELYEAAICERLGGVANRCSTVI